jgi:GNAT superfamily N-acetyltransferase
VAADDEGRVLGYYTLANSRISAIEIPAGELVRLPRYPAPSVLMGKLARDRTQRGTGLGSLLLVDAWRKAVAISAISGVMLFEVHAMSAAARSFCIDFGFRTRLDSEYHLFLTMEDIKRILT